MFVGYAKDVQIGEFITFNNTAIHDNTTIFIPSAIAFGALGLIVMMILGIVLLKYRERDPKPPKPQ
jgi:hypothetical protein